MSDGDLIARGELREASIEAKIIRRDGTVEDLGTVSRWNRDEHGPQGAGPAVRAFYRCRHKIRTRLRR